MTRDEELMWQIPEDIFSNPTTLAIAKKIRHSIIYHSWGNYEESLLEVRMCRDEPEQQSPEVAIFVV